MRLRDSNGDEVQLYALRRRDWMAAAACGAVAWTPGIVAIFGWANHWNAYTNLANTLACVVFWVLLWKAWRK